MISDQDAFTFGWGERIRTFEIPGSEPGALPLGYAPIYGKLYGLTCGLLAILPPTLMVLSDLIELATRFQIPPLLLASLLFTRGYGPVFLGGLQHKTSFVQPYRVV